MKLGRAEGPLGLGVGVRSQKVSGTKKKSMTIIKATIMATILSRMLVTLYISKFVVLSLYQKTHRQPRLWMTAAETSGTRFLPPRSSSV